MTDRELLQRYKDGDGNAFTDFFNRHVNSVTRWVKAAYSLPLSDIDNAVQIAFIGLSRRAEIPDEPLTYLQQAVLQNAKMIKARKKTPSRAGNINFQSIHETTGDGITNTGERFGSAVFIDPASLEEPEMDREEHSAHLLSSLDRAIDSLPPKQKEVICELRNDDDVPKLAKKLKIHRNTLYYHRNLALESLQRMLA